jgi:hypothetical protein
MIGFFEMAFLYVVPSSSIIHFRLRMDVLMKICSTTAVQ